MVVKQSAIFVFFKNMYFKKTFRSTQKNALL